jgi:hypothetical protein
MAPNEKPTDAKPAAVSVNVLADELDEIEIDLSGTKVHLPARIDDWPAEATEHLSEGRVYAAIKAAMRPAELTAFNRLRLTLTQVGEVFTAYAKAAGLTSSGE